MVKSSSSPIPTPFTEGTRANSGLGSLIIFVLLVLVATISAGVLIHSMGLLEVPEAEPTHSADAQPAPPLHVGERMGTVTASESPKVQTITLTVQKTSAQTSVNLADLTIDWFGPAGHTVLTYGATTDTDALRHPDSEFAVAAPRDTDASAPRLDAASDRFTIKIDVAAVLETRGLAPGTTVALKMTTTSGTTQYITLTVPDSLTNQTAVAL